MILNLPDGVIEVFTTSVIGLQAWTLIKLTALDKKLAVLNIRVQQLEKEKSAKD